jgi:hypothetical protein
VEPVELTAAKEDAMNSGPVRGALAHLNAWTWLVAENRTWLIVIVTVIGLAAPFLSASRKGRPRPAPSVVIRSAAMALGFSAAAVTACALLHFSDLRWLPPGQRAAAHLSAPSGLFSFARPIVAAVNSVASVPAEFRATQVAVHAALTCALLALGALLVTVLTWRRARRADIRQIVREEIRRAAAAYVPEPSPDAAAPGTTSPTRHR